MRCGIGFPESLVYEVAFTLSETLGLARGMKAGLAIYTAHTVGNQKSAEAVKDRREQFRHRTFATGFFLEASMMRNWPVPGKLTVYPRNESKV